MPWGPVRTVSMGGVAVGVIVILFGIFLFAWSQGWLPFTLTLGSFCALALILLGVLILGGVLWGRRMMRGGWRRWARDWERDWDRDWQQRPPSPPP